MTPDQINQFFSFLYEGDWARTTFRLQMISGVISSAFLAAIVVIAFKFRELYRQIKAPAIEKPFEPDTQLVRGPWTDIQEKVESSNPSDWNLAIIQADSILDQVFRDMGLLGQTMGDRLKQLDRSKLASLDAVWEAHKLRNRIAHESDRVITHEEAKRAIGYYEEALRELHYLEE